VRRADKSVNPDFYMAVDRCCLPAVALAELAGACATRLPHR